MKPYFTYQSQRKTIKLFLTAMFLVLMSSVASAQLGVYSFTGAGACPNQNPNVTTQPANASFIAFSNTNATCVAATDVFQNNGWNTTAAIDLTEYNEFTITPNTYYSLTLTTLSFTHLTDENAVGGTTWALRSSVDGFAADIATGSASTTSQSPTVNLPAANFTNVGAVTFRLYILNANSATASWSVDDVTLSGSVNVIPPANPANPTSNSPQCSTPGVTLTSSGSAPSGETWYWQTSAAGTSTANSASTYTVNTSGTYYIRSQNNTTLAWSTGAGSLTVTISPDVTIPIFTLGASSMRCQGNGNVTYTANATNTSGITYSLDAASITGGNTINSNTGMVNYVPGWSGTSFITASAVGCNGPKTAIHTVTITPTVGVPVFTLGATSTRCQGAGTVTYTATATNNTGITYSLDFTTDSYPGNSINIFTGAVTYAAGWTGTSIITVTAAGCNGPKTATHTVTTTPTVGTPVFTLGASSTRCQGAGTVTYTATATNNTGITYTLDATSSGAGNTINPATGAVTYVAGWNGASTITATATGCNGPSTVTHTATSTLTVGTPVFTLGASSVRCQGAGTVTYTATATNNTGITYSLDFTTDSYPGNSINIFTGAVTYAAGWTGTSTITVTAAGCNGPTTATHNVATTPTVGTPVFTLGASSTRCQGAGTVTYTATSTNNTGITYSLDAGSLGAGNTINIATGDVTYTAVWNGTTVITATATGCNGPKTATHTVTVNGILAAPVFTLGATTTRCQGAATVTYTATATNNSGITYTLDATSITGGNTINAATGAVTYAAGWSGTSTITASAAGCGGPLTATHTVTITPTVGTPVFVSGATSTRCQGAGTVTYTANATTTTGITYTLDAASTTGGNSINAATGMVTYLAGWSGTSVITASAAGCSGPKTATHTVTITPTVGTPVFTLGATSARCIGLGTVTYTATATNNTGITYTLDAGSLAGGNTINAATGAVTYALLWTGPSTITATATGCNGPSTATHTATTGAAVTSLAFTLGATSTRCQGAGTVTYTATATNTTGITYTLDLASVLGGNTINAATGAVTYTAGWTGTSTITANAAGCLGPISTTHTVTITPTVGTPVFTSGASSARCQGANTVTYTATSTNNTGITYTLDAASTTGGNTINAATGAVTYVAGWTGTSTITATATGCNGPKTAIHTVTINITVGATNFTLGASSVRCQGAGSVIYTATATNNTGIVYTLDAASVTGGNSINAATGAVTYVAGWSGTSTITATASGCNGPTTATHTATITPTVGTPVFTSGSTSTRCQGPATVIYTATATTTTGITYTLDAASITGGNTINAATGAVTFASVWTGTSTITATAAGCNGPKTATHTVTITASVGTPIFVIGAISTRTQGAGTVTYTATATTTTGITYTLDAASITGGNTINAATGAVTYSANWNGTTIITASAAGCSGPTTATHTVLINATTVTKQLYLSDPGQILDRIDPVATGITTTVQTATLSSGGTNNVTFTQNPVLCADLTIKAQTITVTAYVTISSGSMPASPNITAALSYGGTNIITLSNPSYNSGTLLLTWTATLGADVTVPAGSAIAMVITTAQSGVNFKIDYHSQTKPSKISLPVSTFIDITSFDVYSAAYPGGSIRNSAVSTATEYARAVVTDPFGAGDINGTNINFTPPNSNVAAILVNTAGCTKTYEYTWTTPGTSGNYILTAIAKEGFENTVTKARNLNFTICSSCPPVAVNDSARGAGGAPIIVDVLANDYDPNNNINTASLGISMQPSNGTAFLSNGKIVYLPNGSFAGKDTVTYAICDNTVPVPLCTTGKIFFTIDPLLIDPCSDATKSHTYYIPFSENDARIALDSSTTTALASNNIRTIISLKMPYPGMIVIWDEWEDGYETSIQNPAQTTTKVWGDGNPYNGIAPGYADDIIPPGGSIVLDNIIPTNPRVSTNFFYDGRDKIYSSGQIAVTQVCGEPSNIGLQCMKTNVSATADYGTSFTIPVGQNFNSQDFRYTALFIRAQQDNTTLNIDKDNNGTFETTATINQGQIYHVNGGVLSGATVTSSAPIGVDLHFGGNDNFSSREVPIFPASWYSNIYYSPVPTTGRAANPADSAVVMLYNSLSNRSLTINWSSGIPSSGSVVIPPKSVIRFPMALSATAAYKFVNPTGEAFTAIEIVDSYTPGGGGNVGSDFDWAFNLIAEARLTDYATIAWAPGSTDGTRDDNPVWVTPTANTIIYVKYNGDVVSGGSVSSCGLHYDVSYALNALNYKKLLDLSDNDQSGLAVFTCDGTKLAAVYGEDPSTAVTANPSWDVGSTIQPFCKQKLIFANDDYARTLVNQPVTIPVLLNDYGFLATVDPASVTNTGLLLAKNGTITINANGTILYTPNPGFTGQDTFEYSVCSTPSPIVCDVATVIVQISICPAPLNQNLISGQVFLDKNKDGFNNDGGTGFSPAKVYLYVDGNCNNTIDANELKDSVTVDASGTYQFITYPEKTVADDFDGPGGTSSCASGTDGSSAWAGNWVDAGDPSGGFCNNTQTAANTDAEIVKDGAFSNALRLKDNNVSATRVVNLSGASYAFLTFSYRRKSATLTAGKNVIVQASSNGATFSTVFTIAGNGTADASYITIYNQDITAYASATTYIRFLTNNNVADADTVYIDNVSVKYIKYPQCYMTQLNAAYVPAAYHTTTPTLHSLTATNGVTCLAPYDFGIARNSVSITGTLFNDANGLTDGMVNGTGIGSPGGGITMYAYLVDAAGKVAFKATLAANGTYTFPQADVQTTYTVVLSSSDVALYSNAPTDVNMPSDWVATGDAYGVNNMAGSGIKSGTPSCSITVTTGLTNVTGVNFGCQRPPDSDPKSTSYTINVPGQKYDVPGLTGLDPEDGILGTGKTYKITTLPNNAVLYYNGVLVTLNQVIPSFDASLLKIDPNDNVILSTFTYAAMDAAGMYDPTPATVTISWLAVLPITSLEFTGKLNGTKVNLNWKTGTEVNSDHFEVEKSTDGANFTLLANVKAKGNSVITSYYGAVDPLPSKGLNYYRLKMVDRDGRYVYSQVIVIKINDNITLTTAVKPNPFTNSLDIYVTIPHASAIELRLLDVAGKVVYTRSVKGNQGFNTFNIKDLDKLSNGTYILQIVTDDSMAYEKMVKQ